MDDAFAIALPNSDAYGFALPPAPIKSKSCSIYSLFLAPAGYKSSFNFPVTYDESSGKMHGEI